MAHRAHRAARTGRRWLLVSSALALTAAGGTAAVAAVSADADGAAVVAQVRAPEAPRTEGAAPEVAEVAPRVTAPEDAEWSLGAVEAEAQAPVPREPEAASRTEERVEPAPVEEETAETETEAAEPEPEPVVDAAVGTERGALLSMLNGYRAANGLHTLTTDPHLDSLAQSWAEWMATHQTLQHNPNLRAQMGSGWSIGSEIIVRHTGGASMSPDAIVDYMHNWWRGSTVHNNNMLSSAFTHVGTGYFMGPGGPYAVHVFGG